MLLECTYCRNREVVYLNEMELRAFETNRGIARHCKTCRVPSIWTQAPHEDEKKLTRGRHAGRQSADGGDERSATTANSANANVCACRRALLLAFGSPARTMNWPYARISRRSACVFAASGGMTLTRRSTSRCPIRRTQRTSFFRRASCIPRKFRRRDFSGTARNTAAWARERMPVRLAGFDAQLSLRRAGAFARAARVIAASRYSDARCRRSFKAKNCGLGILPGLGALLFGQQRRRKHLELKSAVVQLRDGVADHHVRELADGFGNDRLGRIDFALR